MSRFSKLAAALAVLPVLAVTGSALADSSPGQLGGGSEVYKVKDLTQGGSYANTISANACDEVEYSILLHNTSFGGFSNVHVNVSLPGNSSTSNVSNVTATTNLGGISGTSGTATVNINSAQTVSYENGTTLLYNGSGSVIKTLPDTVTTSGVDIGALNGSTTEFVNFKAKISCPQPTPVVSFACTQLDVAQVDRTHFDFTARASVQNANVQSYGFTAKDSNGSTVDTNTVSTNALSAVYHFNQSNAGTYKVSAVVNTDHGTASSTNCVKQITVAPNTPTPTPTPTPSLPNTGAGDVIGIFTGVSAAGTAAHAIVSRRRRGL